MVGAGVLVLSLFLDRADGELARLSGKMSPGGHLYDLVADGTSNAAVFIGIGVGLWQAGNSPWVVLLGVFAGIAVAIAELLVMRLDSASVRSSADLGGRWGFDPDDGMFVVPIAMFFGWGNPLLVLAAIGGSMAAVVLLVLWFRRRENRVNG